MVVETFVPDTRGCSRRSVCPTERESSSGGVERSGRGLTRLFASSAWRLPENLQPASHPRIHQGAWTLQQSASRAPPPGAPPARRDGVRAGHPRPPGDLP